MNFTDRIIEFIKEKPATYNMICRYFRAGKNSTTEIIKDILDKKVEKGLLVIKDDVYHYNHEFIEKIIEDKRKKQMEKEEKQRETRLNEVLHFISAGKMDIRLTEKGLEYVKENYGEDPQTLSINVLKKRLCEK